MKNKTILVTGAAGFIGKSLIRALVKDEYTVIAIDICEIPESLSEIADKIQWVNYSFTHCALDKKYIKKHFPQIDCSFHLATTLFPAESKVNIEKDCYENVYCTVEFFSQLYAAGCKKIVYASSAGTVYGFHESEQDLYFTEETKKQPSIPYGLTKSVCEEYLTLLANKYNAKGLSLRVSNPYGEEQKLEGNQGVIPIFMNKISKNIELPVSVSIKSKRDYIYIDDLISAFCLSIDYDGGFNNFNVCYGEAHSLEKIISETSACVNRGAKIKFTDSISNGIQSVLLSNELLKQEFNWKPTVNISQGIERLAKYHNII